MCEAVSPLTSATRVTTYYIERETDEAAAAVADSHAQSPEAKSPPFQPWYLSFPTLLGAGARFELVQSRAISIRRTEPSERGLGCATVA